MYITILLLPAYGAIISGLLGRKLGSTGSQLVATASVTLSIIFAIIGFYEVSVLGHVTTISLTNWINSELFNVTWNLNFDQLTISILVPVLVVSSCVHIFSIDYIGQDPHTQRFFSYLSIFTFFMLVLVSAANYAILFIGWEGIGVSSYLLINYWFTRIQANKSAINAIITNRVGDISLSISFLAIFACFGSLDFTTIYMVAPFINENILTFIGLTLLFAAIGKSAQFGLHIWLPQAIEGPTPVSALIHAATLVTAGVYLLIRSSPILEFSSTSLIAILWVGAVTAFFAASVGLFQNDLKRVIAYSTCSQIGYLFIACGLSQYNVSLFHLVNHAFFKALLFLSAGAILHATFDQQDQRKIGGLLGFIPFTYVNILIGSLSLIAVPYITGYYSKDLILELAYSQYTISGHFAYWIGTISAAITSIYSFRLISLSFLGFPNASKKMYNQIHDAPIIVIVPLAILSGFAIFFGYMCRDLFVGIGTNFVGSSLFIHPSHVTLVEAEFSLPLLIKLLPAVVTIIGALFSFITYQSSISDININQNNTTFNSSITPIMRTIYKFFNGKYFIDPIYKYFVLDTVLNQSYSISKVLDRGIIEQLGPKGLSQTIYSTSRSLSENDTGLITDYAFYIAVGIVVFTNVVLNSVYGYYPTSTLLLLVVLFISVFIPSYKKLFTVNTLQK